MSTPPPLLLLVALFAMTSCDRSEPAPAAPGDAVVYLGATVITLDPEHPRARGVRVAGGRITHVFDDDGADLSGLRVDLGGATVLPGLTDAHLHLRAIGAAARRLDLRGTATLGAVTGQVAAAAEAAEPGGWIRGRGWDQNDWPTQEFPVAADLDRVAPDNPVWLSRIDGHAVWVNTRVLELVGVDAQTPDPPGGELLRDEQGRPTGIFIDNAIDLISAALPAPTAEAVRADYERGVEACNRAGLTGVHDMGVDALELAALRALQAEGRLTLRTTAYLADDEGGLAAEAPFRQGTLEVVGVKLYADGALGSRGAALLQPYTDRSDTDGLFLTEPDALAARVAELHAGGWQLAIHAIGDRGNRVTLAALEATGGAASDRRHRVEHVQILDPADIPRFAAKGVVASMQPTHATSDMPWVEARLGGQRLAGAYAWRSLLDDGAILAFGSDAPIERHEPWPGIHAAVTRQDATGQPVGGWLPEQRLRVEEALAGFTLGAARAAHAEGERGTIRPGLVADLTVVDQDPTALPTARLLEVATMLTIVGGDVVFDRTRQIQ